MISTSGGTAPAAFDTFISIGGADVARSAGSPPQLTAGTPTTTSSLPTLIGAFLATALAQILVALASAVIFDLPGVRVVLIGLVVAPAVLYVVVAAWDHRELTTAGAQSPPSPLWAVLPPVYLLLRRRSVTGSAHRRRTVLGWSVAQSVFTAAFALVAAAAVVTSPMASAEAASAGSAPTTVEQLEEAVEAGWADEGTTGVASCSGPAELAPQTEIDCTGSLAGVPLRFTATVGDSAAGQSAITIASWSEIPSP